MTTTPQLAHEIALARLEQIRRDVRTPRPAFAWLRRRA